MLSERVLTAHSLASLARSPWTVTNFDTRADIGANIDHFDAAGGLKGNQKARKVTQTAYK